MKWSPIWTKSHFLEYVKKINIENHAGVSLGIECILQYGTGETQTTTTLTDNQPKFKLNSSKLLSKLYIRAKYNGEIASMVDEYGPAHMNNLINNVLAKVKEACHAKSDKMHQDALWKATALLIALPESNRKLLHCIASSQLDLFTEEAMNTAVSCWQWLITAKPHLEIRFLQEMIAAWSYTVQKRMGLFSVDEEGTSPLAASEGEDLRSQAPFITPHKVWVQFISGLIEEWKYNSYEKVEMLATLIHHSLPMNVGSSNPCQSRHISAVGVRFQLLQCGLTLLQGDALPKSIAKNVLRERIYYSCLDYFCRPISCPTQPLSQLKEDITILIKFWHTMSSDKKYLKVSHVFDLDLGTTQSMSSMEMNKPDIGRMQTGWINTVPLSNSTATLSKRSTKVTKRVPDAENFVKCYLKKRNLIRELLVSFVCVLIIIIFDF